MHKTRIHGLEGMGFLSLLTLHGVLLGLWDMNWGKRVMKTWALPSISFIFGYLNLCGVHLG